MLSNIKAYQSERASGEGESALSFLKLSFMLYTGCLFTKASLAILTKSCHVCLHSHEML